MAEELIKIEDKRVWTKRQVTKDVTSWTSMWWCPDGDGVELYIENEQSGFELHCFSGIPASSIYIDTVDFGTMWDKVKKTMKVEPIGTYSFEQQCVYIADYLCSLFCEWTDVTNYKKDEAKN